MSLYKDKFKEQNQIKTITKHNTQYTYQWQNSNKQRLITRQLQCHQRIEDVAVRGRESYFD